MAESRPYAEHPKQASAASGCMIPIVMALVVAALLGIAGYSFFQQNREIDKIASAEPIDHRPDTPVLEEADQNVLAEKMRGFAENSPSHPLQLTAKDLNHLIQSLPELEELQSMVIVESIDEDGIRAQVSLPVRSLPGTSPRFLNGGILCVPRVEDQTFFLDLKEFTVPGKPVPTGFITGLRQNRYLGAMFLKPFEPKTAIWETIQSINEVTLEANSLTLARNGE